MSDVREAIESARQIVRTALDSNPAVLAVLEAKADSWVHRLIPAIAAALDAARAAEREACAVVAEAFGLTTGQRTYAWSAEQSARIAAAIRARGE
jgi:protein-disulfide isomerase-like protein with CxxC motif